MGKDKDFDHVYMLPDGPPRLPKWISLDPNGAQPVGRVWFCSVCDRAECGTQDPPAGWATGHSIICSAECMRALYAGMAVAQMFPAEATEDECRALFDHEAGILEKARSVVNPRLAGHIRGFVFHAREERAELRQAKPQRLLRNPPHADCDCMSCRPWTY